MKEYKIIEEQENKKIKKNALNRVRAVSAAKTKEIDKEVVNPMNLRSGELPNSILYKIDKMVRERITNMSDEELDTLLLK